MRFAGWIDKKKTAGAALLAAALITALTGCGGSKEEDGVNTESGEVSVSTDSNADSSDTENTETKTKSDMVYEGTIAAKEAPDDESVYYGVMHATVIEINNNASSTIYTFSDKRDPDNGWSFSGLEIGDIETELKVGDDVAILFSGDIINDSENVDFIVVLEDGDYRLRRIEGKTISNVMSTFTVQTASGEEICFTKDNCRIDSNALSGDSGDTVIVYYADGGELGNYPLRVFKGR